MSPTRCMIGVGVDRRGRVGAAVAAHVGRDGVVAGRGERRELVPPRVPALGKAVAEQHERPLAGLGDVHRQVADLELAMADRRRRSSSLRQIEKSEIPRSEIGHKSNLGV